MILITKKSLAQAENYCDKKDLLIIISSSGNSENIKEIIKFAKKKKIKTIGFSGFKGGYLKKLSLFLYI